MSLLKTQKNANFFINQLFRERERERESILIQIVYCVYYDYIHCYLSVELFYYIPTLFFINFLIDL